jgi:hypothetical protein
LKRFSRIFVPSGPANSILRKYREIKEAGGLAFTSGRIKGGLAGVGNEEKLRRRSL